MIEITDTGIEGLLVIKPRIFEDERGYFFESYNLNRLKEAGIQNIYVQDNQSRSTYGIIRGLHFQKDPKAQSKIVRVVEGTIFDVAVDLREDSPTYGEWFGIELSEENKFQIFIPKGFAHGFSVLSDTATVVYKCDEFYSQEHESGIRYNDPDLKIDWKIPSQKITVSEKDNKLGFLSDYKN